MTPDEIMVDLEFGIVIILLIDLVIMSISLFIQIDDVYGITTLKKYSQRNLRKFWRITTRYFKGE